MSIFMPETLLNKLRMTYDTVTHSCIINICSVFTLHTCQPPDKMFLDIGINFPVLFSKMFLVLILTIIDDYKSLFFLFYLLLHATMTFHFMNSTPADRKVTTTNCILHKIQGILPFAVRMSSFLNRWLD